MRVLKLWRVGQSHFGNPKLQGSAGQAVRQLQLRRKGLSEKVLNLPGRHGAYNASSRNNNPGPRCVSRQVLMPGCGIH